MSSIIPTVILLLVLGTIALGFHLAERSRKRDYERHATKRCKR